MYVFCVCVCLIDWTSHLHVHGIHAYKNIDKCWWCLLFWLLITLELTVYKPDVNIDTPLLKDLFAKQTTHQIQNIFINIIWQCCTRTHK